MQWEFRLLIRFSSLGLQEEFSFIIFKTFFRQIGVAMLLFRKWPKGGLTNPCYTEVMSAAVIKILTNFVVCIDCTDVICLWFCLISLHINYICKFQLQLRTIETENTNALRNPVKKSLRIFTKNSRGISIVILPRTFLLEFPRKNMPGISSSYSTDFSLSFFSSLIFWRNSNRCEKTLEE